MAEEKSTKDMPKQTDKLPEHAKHIYREAHNAALKEYSDPSKRRARDENVEEVAHKIAWNAVKKDYYKGEDGEWHRKAEA